MKTTQYEYAHKEDYLYKIASRLDHITQDIHMYLYIKFREDLTIFGKVRILPEKCFTYDIIAAILKIVELQI